MLCYTFNAFYNIIYISKIAQHITIVIHIYWLAINDSFGKERQCHIWSAPRSIYRKKPKACYWQAVHITVHMRHQFVTAFGSGVQRDGMIHSITGRKYFFLIHAIYARTAGIHQVFYLVLLTALQYI